MLIDFPKTTEACTRCGSKHFKKSGKLKDNVTRYFCNDCRRYFAGITFIVPRSSYPIEVYETVIDLHTEQGLGRLRIFNALSKIYKECPSTRTISHWLYKFHHNQIWRNLYYQWLDSSPSSLS